MVRRARRRYTLKREENGYGCALCGTPLFVDTSITSRNFHGKHGKAYLVNWCMNYYYGPQETKELMTGTHVVRDVFCNGCDKYIGWGYDFAHDDKERYKVHRFVLERQLIRIISIDRQQGTVAVADGSEPPEEMAAQQGAPTPLR